MMRQVLANISATQQQANISRKFAVAVFVVA
jgi:hypothetical protein